MDHPRYPAVYQVNVRVWLGELSRRLGRSVALDQVPDDELDRLGLSSFDWVWLLGVWQTGEAGRAVSRTQPAWRAGYEHALPDLTEDDITGSPFAVQSYTVHADVGGDDALQGLRARLAARGLRLMLDFVPNHTAPDHPWVAERPDRYVQGSEDDLAREPENYGRVMTAHGPRVLAYGRAAYASGWPDTFQLDYRDPDVREAMLGELVKVAGLCDGLRCDMAMLVLPDIFEGMWAGTSPRGDDRQLAWSFWPEAIRWVRRKHPDFVFVAEAYWDTEWTLQQQGFDFAYDKTLYDRLLAEDAGAVRDHLRADPEYQRRLVRFVENHDEPRAAHAFRGPVHQAAAVVTFLSPGMRLFHDGQLEGRRIQLPVHLARRPAEPVDPDVRDFYARLLRCLSEPAVRDGDWQLLECRPAWDGNRTSEQLIAYGWQGPGDERVVVAVNYGPARGQAYVRLPFRTLGSGTYRVSDVIHAATYEASGHQLATPGLYVDLPAWGYHVFRFEE